MISYNEKPVVTKPHAEEEPTLNEFFCSASFKSASIKRIHRKSKRKESKDLSYSTFNRELRQNPHTSLTRNIGEARKRCLNGGHLSGLYRAFSERMQCMNNRQTKSWMEILKGFIVVGNLSAGGDMVLHEVLYDFAGGKNRPEALLLSAREYGRYSLKGDLLESDRVRDRLNRFVEMLVNKFKD